MTAARLLRQARYRTALLVLLAGLPPWLALCMVLARLVDSRTAGVAALAGLLMLSAGAVWRARQRDVGWLIAKLNAHPRFEDSADLLFAAPATLNPLQQRQRLRIQTRLQAQPPDLRSPWPWPALLLSMLVAITIAIAGRWWPLAESPTAPFANTPAAAEAPLPSIRRAQLQLVPPAYTGQPARTSTELDARVPYGTTIHWQLRFQPQPKQAWLQFHDGRRMPLTMREDGQWGARDVLRHPSVYRIVTLPALADPPRNHRLQPLPDLPPRVKVIEPAQTLTLANAQQRQWRLLFEAEDDYGIARTAQLQLVLGKGSGENVEFRHRQLTLSGHGPATARRFAHVVDLAALALEPGDELVARLGVLDNRNPQPQPAQSPGLILRMPSTQDIQSSDLEGAIKKVMPAYFRSQRQIILDAEALLKQRRSLAADEFIRRSDAIGVDQRILRLRYGQFLGEEAEGGAKPLPTSDVDDTDDGHDGQDDHGHDSQQDDNTFGRAEDVLSEFGHTHDHAEAATLLDPRTRATLKAALDQMWQSEGALRQGQPGQALPHAYKALGFIKQVQQAERIYLARIGPELPPIDMTRRMGGKREGLGSRSLQINARDAGDNTPTLVWQALGQANAAIDLEALSRWLESHPDAVPDPLALLAAGDTLRQRPDCQPCRQQLRALLWPALARPPGPPARRAAADAAGRRYLLALPQTGEGR